jgi:hypothetical protein
MTASAQFVEVHNLVSQVVNLLEDAGGQRANKRQLTRIKAHDFELLSFVPFATSSSVNVLALVRRRPRWLRTFFWRESGRQFARRDEVGSASFSLLLMPLV